MPLDDARNYYWQLEQNSNGGGEVYFGHSEGSVINRDDNHYANEIYTQRFLPKWVYRGEDYTMVVVDTHTDGNKFLQIFDNSKELKQTEEGNKEIDK